MEVRTNEVAKQRIEDEGYRAHNNPFGLNLFLFSSFCQPYMASLATVQGDHHYFIIILFIYVPHPLLVNFLCTLILAMIIVAYSFLYELII